MTDQRVSVEIPRSCVSRGEGSNHSVWFVQENVSELGCVEVELHGNLGGGDNDWRIG